MMVGSAVAHFTFGWGPSRLEAEAAPSGVTFTCHWQGQVEGTFECSPAELRSLLEDGAPVLSDPHRLERRSDGLYYRCVTTPKRGGERSVSIELDRIGLTRLLAAVGPDLPSAAR